MIPRVLLAVVSAALVAAALVWLDAARAERRGIEAAFGHETPPSELAAALRDARKLRRLSPDAPAELLAATLLLRSERRAASARAFERVVRMEPENLQAWLYLSSATSDPGTGREARRRAFQLNPRLRSGVAGGDE